MCEAFLGIAPNKDLFWKVFEVTTRKVHGSDGSVLAFVGGMNLQMRQGFTLSYPCLSLKCSNSSWHNHWFYIRDDAATPVPSFSSATLIRLLSKVMEILRILEG